MPTPTDRQKTQKTRDQADLPRASCAHQESSTKLQDSKALVPINTFKKECDDDDAAANGFPQDATRREEG